MKYFARLDDALMNTSQDENVGLCSIGADGRAKPLPTLYPMPAIPLAVKWIADKSNPFYGVSIRDNKGWANVTWSPEYGLEYNPRNPWQCEYCGGYHKSEHCTI